MPDKNEPYNAAVGLSTNCGVLASYVVAVEKQKKTSILLFHRFTGFHNVHAFMASTTTQTDDGELTQKINAANNCVVELISTLAKHGIKNLL